MVSWVIGRAIRGLYFRKFPCLFRMQGLAEPHFRCLIKGLGTKSTVIYQDKRWPPAPGAAVTPARGAFKMHILSGRMSAQTFGRSGRISMAVALLGVAFAAGAQNFPITADQKA